MAKASPEETLVLPCAGVIEVTCDGALAAGASISKTELTVHLARECFIIPSPREARMVILL
ncbi:MAG: hypothetical protein ONB45_20485 [candidate division KSB1 bacterium]|nr:hypothetical protein [candidate division KSB1 bacterium]